MTEASDDRYRIRSAEILPIYDSRARQTLSVTVCTADASGTGVAPAGASRGHHEAHELRDPDGGLISACAKFRQEIAPSLLGMDCRNQVGIDQALITLDGTDDRSRLGANTLIATSMGTIALAAASAGIPLWQYLAEAREATEMCMPLPQIQILGGGAHADGRLPLQDFMVVPLGAEDWPTALSWVAEVYHAAGRLMSERGLLQGVADEGGWWPNLESCEAALDLLVLAIETAGRKPLDEIAISLDIAANQFYRNGCYHVDGEALTPDTWVEKLLSWTRRYPIRMVEDPCAEDDPVNYAAFYEGFHQQGLIVGDDLVVSNGTRIRRAVKDRQINAALIKPNQVGTLTEAHEALLSCPVPIVSARSGETEDSCIVDLALGWQAPLIKVGSITRGERTAKWNRGLRIHQAHPMPLMRFPYPDTKSQH